MVIRVRVLVGLALAVGGYVIVTWSDADTSAPTDARAGSGTTNTLKSRARVSTGSRDDGALAYRLAHRVAQHSSAESLFVSHSWLSPPPPAPPPPPAIPVAIAPAAPVAPPVPFTYMGSFAPNGAAPVYFLTRGDRVYDVHVGDVIDGIYGVDSFNSGQLVLIYRPLNQKQTLTAGEAK